MGRPQKKIDQTQFEKLCGLQCTKAEIAGWFDCSEDTIDNWCHKTYDESFSVVFSKKREVGKISLRRSQFRLAEKSAAMAIFLGKNYLGQKDNIIETDEQTLQAVGEALVKIKRAAEQADNNE